MDINEILQAIGGQNQVPHQPDGGSDVTPLSPLGLDKSGPEPFPVNVSPAQGAGSAGYLTPGAKGTAADGTVESGNDDHYSSQGGPEQLPVVKGIEALTAGGNFGANRPGVGDVPAGPVAVPPPEGPGREVISQGINPALKAALAPRPGPFGEPSI